MSELITIKDLEVQFKVRSLLSSLVYKDVQQYIQAVAGVSFSIKQGETFGLVGESGSGKTTLGQSIVGLTPTSAGSIEFQNEKINGLSEKEFKPYRKKISMMFQDPVGCLSPRLKLRTLLAQPFRAHGIKVPNSLEKAHELLDIVGLPNDFAQRYPHQLSGGQARRVGLAKALALNPKLIIADEPTAGLDVSIQGDILNLLGQVQKKTGVGILAITHNLAVVRHISHRMAIMYLGRFVETGNTDEIFKCPAHPYTRALLEANPTPDPDVSTTYQSITGDVPSLMNRPSGCEFHSRCPECKDICKVTPPSEKDLGNGRTVLCHFPQTSSF